MFPINNGVNYFNNIKNLKFEKVQYLLNPRDAYSPFDYKL